MCLIIFAYQQHSDWPLILAANRDEFHQRPTAHAHHWSDQADIFAGRDLEAGGTWLGINQLGNFSALTNFRSGQEHSQPDTYSRGKLCQNFLSNNTHVSDFMLELHTEAQHYAGFNLLAGNHKQLQYFSNQDKQSLTLAPGMYGLSNGRLNEPWPKVSLCKSALQQLLQDKKLDQQSLLSMMKNLQTAPDHQLPSTGVSLEKERFLSSPFIISEQYGTRCTTVLRFHRDSYIEFTEQNYDPLGQAQERIEQLIHCG